MRTKDCCKFLPNTTLSCIDGEAIISDPDHSPIEGKLNMGYGKRGESILNSKSLSVIGFSWNLENTVSNYWILSTDYDNYSIVYLCKNIDDNKSAEIAHLLSKQPQLNPAVQATVDSLIDAHFERAKMYKSDQSSDSCDPRNE